MNKLRMSSIELNELKPSWDNQIELVCDDGYYKDHYKSNVTIISPSVGGYYSIIDQDGELNHLVSTELQHYPSFKKEKKFKTMYQGVITIKDGVYKLSPYLFETHKDLQVFHGEYKEVQLLTDRPIQIEVEE